MAGSICLKGKDVKRQQSIRRRSIVSWYDGGRVSDRIRIFDKKTEDIGKCTRLPKEIKVSINVKEIVTKFEVPKPARSEIDMRTSSFNNIWKELSKNDERSISVGQNVSEEKCIEPHLGCTEMMCAEEIKMTNPTTVIEKKSEYDQRESICKLPSQNLSTKNVVLKEECETQDSIKADPIDKTQMGEWQEICKCSTDNPDLLLKEMGDQVVPRKSDWTDTNLVENEVICETLQRRRNLRRFSNNCISTDEDTSNDEGYRELEESCKEWLTEAASESIRSSFRWRKLERTAAFDEDDATAGEWFEGDGCYVMGVSSEEEVETEAEDNHLLEFQPAQQLFVKPGIHRDSWRNKPVKRKNGTDEEVTLRHNLMPWEKREHYQTYARKSDDLMTSQLENQYNSSNCLDFASYFLIRNGNRITFNLEGISVPRSSALDFITGPRKTLWQYVPEVLSSGCLLSMSKKEVNLQEALFEIISSEASYLYSLTILEGHFMKSLKKMIPYALTGKVFNSIFSKIEPVIKSARVFFGDLLQIWQGDIMLKGLCDVIETNYVRFSEPYLKYARNSEDILNIYQKQKEENQIFNELVTALAETPEADKLPLDSFLNLPLQRITRMPLLLKNVIAQASFCEPPICEKYMKTLLTVETLARRCNDEVGQVRQWEEMLRVTQELLFPPDVMIFALAKSARFLVLRSPARRVKNGNRLARKEHLELFLFNDLFLFARKHNEKQLVVCNYCPRSALFLRQGKSLFSSVILHLMSNDNGKKQILEVVFDRTSDRQRWLTTHTMNSPMEYSETQLSSPKQKSDKQVIVLHKYEPARPDELALEIGDIVQVFEEQDEWIRGERLLDGEIGWFPASSCKVITSASIRRFNSCLRKELRKNGLKCMSLNNEILSDESHA